MHVSKSFFTKLNALRRKEMLCPYCNCPEIAQLPLVVPKSGNTATTSVLMLSHSQGSNLGGRVSGGDSWKKCKLIEN